MNNDLNEISGNFSILPQTVFRPNELDDIVVHNEPRISANKLAEYIVADPSRQKVIIKDSKFAKKVIITRYKKARAYIAQSFSGNSLDIDKLVKHADKIDLECQNATSEEISDWNREDHKASAIILRKIAKIAHELSWKNARQLHFRVGAIEIAKVSVSVHPEIIFAFEHRNVTKVGAIILNTAKNDNKSLDRMNGNYCVGDYLTSLLFQSLLEKMNKIGLPLNSKCYAIDVFREKVHSAPASYKTLNKHLEAACEVIALRWPETQMG
jgi:hypothetical protein